MMRRLIQRPSWYLFWVFWGTFWGILSGRMALEEILLVPQGPHHILAATVMFFAVVGFAVGVAFNMHGMVEVTRRR